MDEITTAVIAAADSWWEQQSDERRVQIFRWITRRRGVDEVEQVPGQLEFLELREA